MTSSDAPHSRLQNLTTPPSHLDPVRKKSGIETIPHTSVKMSTAQTPPAPNLQLDEVTGEMVSKSELKKRQKARAAEAKKAEKAAAQPQKEKSVKEVALADLNPNVSARVKWRSQSDTDELAL